MEKCGNDGWVKVAIKIMNHPLKLCWHTHYTFEMRASRNRSDKQDRPNKSKRLRKLHPTLKNWKLIAHFFISSSNQRGTNTPRLFPQISYMNPNTRG